MKVIMQTQEKDQTVIIPRGKFIDSFLFDLLTQPTPHGNEHLLQPIIEKFIGRTLRKDNKGNLFIKLKRPDPAPASRTLFSCHLDTVHIDTDPIKLLYIIKGKNVYDSGMIYGLSEEIKEHKGIKETKYTKSVLGADDKLGIYTLCCMIRHGIPGTYIFHVGEECGGIGSRAIAEAWKDGLTKLYDRAIAFDRKGYVDVVYQQNAGICASMECTRALCDALNMYTGTPAQKYVPSNGGTFTDTSSYRNYIPECFNVACGYFDQHFRSEHFDSIWFYKNFIPAVLKVDWEALPTKRDPKAVPVWNNNTNHGSYGHNYRYVRDPVKPENITVSTPSWEVPKFDPIIGRLAGITDYQFEQMVFAWCTPTNNKDIAVYIAKLYNENSKYKTGEKLPEPPLEDKLDAGAEELPLVNATVKDLTEWDIQVEQANKLMDFLWIEYTGMRLLPRDKKARIDKLRTEIEFHFQNKVDIGEPVSKSLASQVNQHLDDFVWALYDCPSRTVRLDAALGHACEYLFSHLGNEGFESIKIGWEKHLGSGVVTPKSLN